MLNIKKHRTLKFVIQRPKQMVFSQWLYTLSWGGEGRQQESKRGEKPH